MPEPESEFYQITNRAADASIDRLQLNLNRSIGNLSVDGDALQRALDAPRLRVGDIDAAIDFKAFEADLEKRLFRDIRRSARQAAEETARKLGTDLDLGDLDRFARRRAKEAARLMARNSRKGLIDAIRRMRRDGFTDASIKRMSKRLAGLNRQQSTAILNRMRALREAGKTQAQAERMARRLAMKARRDRAKFAAGYEAKTGAEIGQDQALAQGVQSGELEDVQHRWASIRDKRRDPICARLHGQTVGLTQKFVDPATGKTYGAPPAHGACRCGRHIVAKKARRAA